MPYCLNGYLFYILYTNTNLIKNIYNNYSLLYILEKWRQVFIQNIKQKTLIYFVEIYYYTCFGYLHADTSDS